MNPNDICRDVGRFLRDLALELPEVFQAPPPARPVPAVSRRAAGLTEDRRERARAIITARVQHWAGLMGLSYNRIAIKDQRTLWGSCSRKGNLNFNWRLAAAPVEALDYIVIHELCHLREMNHSKRFWAHVAGICPDYRARRRWLRENCAAIYQAQDVPAPEQPYTPPPSRQSEASA